MRVGNDVIGRGAHIQQEQGCDISLLALPLNIDLIVRGQPSPFVDQEFDRSLKIKLFGGEVKKILFRRKGVKIEELKNHSWMPDPSRMGMTDQDVRDIAEYLKKL